ncbi:MAG: DUF5677 domain-containing protein [Deltaproteobacteria bacterium]|nr:DUF5677 domain-containing protein [Deltaproteobacteria bacterium]
MPRSKKLQTIVGEQVMASLSATAREILTGAVLGKLREQELDADSLPVDELVERMLSGNGEKVTGVSKYDGEEDRKVSVYFTDDEVKELSTKMDNLVKDGDTMLHECLDLAGKTLLRTLEKKHPEQKSIEEVELYGFKKRLHLRWGIPLDLFRMQLTISRELHGGEQESLDRSRAKTGRVLREALLGIHGRTLRTGTAVLVLLDNGLPDDAYARWRTLYELSVIAEFISEHGEEAANRYLLHETVVLKQRLDNELTWDKKISKKQQREIEKDYCEVMSVYGSPFKNPFGWAAGFVGGKNNPTFADLEQAVKGKRTVPPYKESSIQIHGGRAGLLGLGSSDDVIAIGHSNLGLDIPLMHSSLCLMQVTNLLHYHSPLRDVVLLNVLMRLQEKIERHCRRVARGLAREEAANSVGANG